MKSKYILVLVTCSSRKEAGVISAALLKSRLVACVSIIGGVTSEFWWKGKINTARETLLALKTTRANFATVAREVRRLHSYDVPEVVAIPIVAGSAQYLKWIDESVK